MRCLKLPKQLRQFDAYAQLKKKLEDFDKIFPLITQLKCPDLLERHWTELAKLSGNEKWVNYFYAPESFRLSEILKVDLLAIEDDITDVVICAQKEADIEKRFHQ